MRIQTQKRALLLVFLLLNSGACAPVPQPRPGAAPVLRLRYDATHRYQTIEGWGGEIPNLHWNGGDPPMYQGPTTPVPEPMRAELIRILVEELGMNDFEHIVFSPLIESDNARNTRGAVNGAGFDFSAVDPYVREFLLPLRAAVQARGMPFVLTLKVITAAPRGGGIAVHRFDAQRYSEFAVTVLKHLRGMGLEVTYWVIENEPDLTREWTPQQLGQFTAIVGERFRQAGFATRIAGPESVKPSRAVEWLSQVVNTPGALSYLGRITFHSYDYDPTRGERPPVRDRSSLGGWSQMLRLPVSQTEQSAWGRDRAHAWTPESYEQALDAATEIAIDMISARTTNWRLYLAFSVYRNEGCCGGAPLLLNGDYTQIIRPRVFWAMRRFSQAAPVGAMRVALDATGGEQSRARDVQAVAFCTPAGGAALALVNREKREVTVEVQNLPPGPYRLLLTTREQNEITQSLELKPGRSALEFVLPAESIAAVLRVAPPEH